MSLIKPSNEELEMVERMGATGFTLAEIAEVLLMDEETFLELFNDKESGVSQHYRKGFLLASLELRERIFKDAGHGSSPAQTLAKKILDDCDYKNSQR